MWLSPHFLVVNFLYVSRLARFLHKVGRSASLSAPFAYRVSWKFTIWQDNYANGELLYFPLTAFRRQLWQFRDVVKPNMWRQNQS